MAAAAEALDPGGHARVAPELLVLAADYDEWGWREALKSQDLPQPEDDGQPAAAGLPPTAGPPSPQPAFPYFENPARPLRRRAEYGYLEPSDAWGQWEDHEDGDADADADDAAGSGAAAAATAAAAASTPPHPSVGVPPHDTSPDPQPTRPKLKRKSRGGGSTAMASPSSTQGPRETKRKKRPLSGWVKGWRRFYTALLCAHDPDAPASPALPGAPSRFSSAAGYFEGWAAFATAEAAAVVHEALERDRGQQHRTRPAKERRRAKERGGGVRGAPRGDVQVDAVFTPDEARAEVGPHLLELSCRVQTPSLPPPRTLGATAFSRELLPGCVYVVVPDSPPSTASTPGPSAPFLLAIIHCANGDARVLVSARQMGEHERMQPRPTLTLGCRFVGTVLPYERMAATCGDRPSPPFLGRLLGSPGPSHVFFDDDGAATTSQSHKPATPSPLAPPAKTSGGSLPSVSSRGGGRRRLMVKAADATAAGAGVSEGDAVGDGAGRLNPSQQAALDKALAAATEVGGCEIVVGPPGCGKTHFLVALLARCLSEGVRVLVSAPSNKALCVAIEKLLATPAGQRHANACRLIGNRDALASAAAVPAAEKGSAAVTLFDTFVFTYFASAAARLEQLASAYGEDPGDAGLDEAISPRDQWVARFDGFVAQLDRAAPCTLRSGSPSAHRVLQIARASLLDRHAGPSTAAGAAETLAPAVAALRALDVAANTDTSIYSELLSTAGAVFCTLCSSGQSVVRTMKRVDLLVVDESAQALEPELLIALGARPRALVLVGDPRQLPATVSLASAKRDGYGRSLMERLIEGCGAPHCLLNTQYRMHPKIARWPNAQFYSGRIQTAPEVLRRAPLALARRPHPYTFVDVPDGEEEVARSKSIRNPNEVAVVLHLLQRLSRSNRVDADGDVECISSTSFSSSSSPHTAVITFYAAQREAIARAVRSAGLGSQVHVHTVDSFQGSEADVVIVSFVRANSRGAVGFLADSQRLNVALTRARHHLILVGDVEFLKSAHTAPDLAALATDAQRRGRVAPAAF